MYLYYLISLSHKETFYICQHVFNALKSFNFRRF